MKSTTPLLRADRDRPPRSSELCLQAGAVSIATSKLYTRAVLPAAILACSSSGTRHDLGNRGNTILLPKASDSGRGTPARSRNV
jgi:hypothetical protein